MAGDPQQLPPTVTSDEGMKAGLDITLFERLAVSHTSRTTHFHLQANRPTDPLDGPDFLRKGLSAIAVLMTGLRGGACTLS